MMNKKKTALVVEGGGNRGVFSFGITDSFIKNNFDPFDIYIGVSNGAAVVFWYLMRESGNNLDKMLFGAKSKYINYKNLFSKKDVIAFHDLYIDADNHFKPDLKKLKKNIYGKIYSVVVSDANTAQSEYLQFEESNWINAMIASGTLPLLVKTPSIINGERKFDGGITDPIPVKKAYEMGAREIVVIRTYEKEFKRKIKLENYFAAIYLRNYPNLRRAMLTHDKTYNESLRFINNPPKDCKIHQVCPPHRLTTRRDSTDRKIMEKDYDLGLSVGENFINSFSSNQ